MVNVDDHDRVIFTFPPPDPSGLAVRLLTINPIPAGASNVMVRRAAVLDIGGFDESLIHLSDWDAWTRLAQAVDVAADQNLTVAYVHHAGNQAGRAAKGNWDDLERFRAKHHAEMVEASVQIDEALVARGLAGAQLRAGRRSEAVRSYATSALRHRDLENFGRAIYSAAGLPPRRRRGTAPGWLSRESPRYAPSQATT